MHPEGTCSLSHWARDVVLSLKKPTFFGRPSPGGYSVVALQMKSPQWSHALPEAKNSLSQVCQFFLLSPRVWFLTEIRSAGDRLSSRH